MCLWKKNISAGNKVWKDHGLRLFKPQFCEKETNVDTTCCFLHRTWVHAPWSWCSATRTYFKYVACFNRTAFFTISCMFLFSKCDSEIKLQAVTYRYMCRSDLRDPLFLVSADLQSILTQIETGICLEGGRNKSVKLKNKNKVIFSIFAYVCGTSWGTWLKQHSLTRLLQQISRSTF